MPVGLILFISIVLICLAIVIFVLDSCWYAHKEIKSESKIEELQAARQLARDCEANSTATISIEALTKWMDDILFQDMIANWSQQHYPDMITHSDGMAKVKIPCGGHELCLAWPR